MKPANELLGWWKITRAEIYYFFIQDKLVVTSHASPRESGEWDYSIEVLGKDHPDADLNKMKFRAANGANKDVYYKILGHRLTIYFPTSETGTKLTKVTDIDSVPRFLPKPTPLTFEIPGFCTVTCLKVGEYFCSKPFAFFRGQKRRIKFKSLNPEANFEEYGRTVTDFLSCAEGELIRAEPYIFAFYKDVVESTDDDFPEIKSAKDVWQHIQLGEPRIERREFDQRLYVAIECECEWEPEHGLEIILKDGKELTVVGQYSGHLSNADAYADPTLEKTIYVASSRIL